MQLTDKAGRPIKYYYHTYHERLVTKQSVHNEEETMDDSYPWVAYAENGEDKAEFTVKLRPMQTRQIKAERRIRSVTVVAAVQWHDLSRRSVRRLVTRGISLEYDADLSLIHI